MPIQRLLQPCFSCQVSTFLVLGRGKDFLLFDGNLTLRDRGDARADLELCCKFTKEECYLTFMAKDNQSSSTIVELFHFVLNTLWCLWSLSGISCIKSEVQSFSFSCFRQIPEADPHSWRWSKRIFRSIQSQIARIVSSF